MLQTRSQDSTKLEHLSGPVANPTGEASIDEMLHLHLAQIRPRSLLLKEGHKMLSATDSVLDPRTEALATQAVLRQPQLGEDFPIFATPAAMGDYGPK